MKRGRTFCGFVVGWCIFYSLSVKAQTTFQACYGEKNLDQVNRIIPASDNGFILAGDTKSFSSENGDAYILKIDDRGVLQWSKTFGGPQKEVINDIQPTKDGNYILVGEGYGADASGKLISETGTVIKMAPDGKIIWAKGFKAGNNEAEGFSIANTIDGGYVTAGMMKSRSSLSNPLMPIKNAVDHLYVLKVDKEGNEEWSGYIDDMGEKIQSKGIAIKETENGDYLIAGYVSSEDKDTKILLLVLDNKGSKKSATVLDGNGTGELGQSLIQASDGNFILAGIANEVNGMQGTALTLSKISVGGNVIWSKALYSGKIDYAYKIEKANDDGFVIAGMTDGSALGIFDAFLLKTDMSGNIQWSKAYGGSKYDCVFDVTATKDGYALAGFSLSNTNGSADAYIIKTDINGKSNCQEQSIQLKQTNYELKTSGLYKQINWKLIRSEVFFSDGSRDLPDFTEKQQSSKVKILCNKKSTASN